LFDLLKNAVCIPCPINNNFELKASLLQKTPAVIHLPPFDPVSIYRPLGWSNWPLGVDIDQFENHCYRHSISCNFFPFCRLWSNCAIAFFQSVTSATYFLARVLIWFLYCVSCYVES